ncbi:transposase family protein [Spirillospora sp. CA-128828]|uniref:transposase family protein n=1 Tax=Spirillospora sp. CA-128828 TaxID=3240033 RepID=UPI003D93D3BA
MIPWRATLDVSRELAQYLAGLLQAERHRRGTPKASRALTCFWHAVLVLRWFRDRADPTTLALDHGGSRTTAYRYIDEAIEVLAGQALDLHQALRQAKDQGAAHLVLDGTLISSDRCSEQTISVRGRPVDLWYSGKVRRHGGNSRHCRHPADSLWISAVEPGSIHDMTAARKHLLGALYKAAAEGLPTLADLGYEGAGIGVFTPSKPLTSGQNPDIDTRTRDLPLRALRCQGERGFALLTQRWRVLQHITASPSKIGDIANAALVLTHFEHDRLRYH